MNPLDDVLARIGGNADGGDRMRIGTQTAGADLAGVRALDDVDAALREAGIDARYIEAATQGLVDGRVAALRPAPRRAPRWLGLAAVLALVGVLTLHYGPETDLVGDIAESGVREPAGTPQAVETAPATTDDARMARFAARSGPVASPNASTLSSSHALTPRSAPGEAPREAANPESATAADSPRAAATTARVGLDALPAPRTPPVSEALEDRRRDAAQPEAEVADGAQAGRRAEQAAEASGAVGVTLRPAAQARARSLPARGAEDASAREVTLLLGPGFRAQARRALGVPLALRLEAQLQGRGAASRSRSGGAVFQTFSQDEPPRAEAPAGDVVVTLGGGPGAARIVAIDVFENGAHHAWHEKDGWREVSP